MRNKYATGLLLFGFICSCSYKDNGDINEKKLVEAIYISEGIKSRFPYGLKHSSCRGKEQCRESCLIKLRNYEESFKANDGRGVKSFINFVARRYVGDDDPIGRYNWIKNVTYWYYKQGG